MKAFVFLSAFVLFSLSGNVSAGETTQKILRGSAELDTGSLSFYVASDPDCPFTDADLDSAVASELVRADIKRTAKWKDIVFAVSISCMKLADGTGVIFTHNASFCAASATRHSSGSELTMCDPYPESGLGMGKSSKPSYILGRSMKSVRKSLKEFKKAVTASK